MKKVLKNLVVVLASLLLIYPVTIIGLMLTYILINLTGLESIILIVGFLGMGIVSSLPITIKINNMFWSQEGIKWTIIAIVVLIFSGASAAIALV